MEPDEQPFKSFNNSNDLDEINLRPKRFLIHSIIFLIILITIITLIILLNNSGITFDDGYQVLKLKYNITDNSTETKIIELSFVNSSIINSMKIDNKLKNFSNYFLFESTGEHSVEITLNNSFSSLKKLFFNCKNLTEIDLSDIEIKNVNSATDMFYGCSNLKKIYFGNNFKTDNIINMDGMFYGCNSLTSIYLSQFNTKKVTTMSKMFSGCNSLTSIDVTRFSTITVNDMSEMFCDCEKLTKIDLSKFNTKLVYNMSKMFSGSKSITSLNLADFNTDNLEEVNYMFSDCKSLNYLDLSSFNLSKIDDLEGMFNNLNNEGKIVISEKFSNITLPEIFNNWEIITK